MTDIDLAKNLGEQFGQRRAAQWMLLAGDDYPTVLIGFDTAVRALVELSIAAGWDQSTQDAFWQAYDREGESPVEMLAFRAQVIEAAFS